MTWVLFDYWRSSASYRARIALNLKGVDYQRVDIDLVAGAQREADYRARNPQGFVPMLDADGVKVTQSLAIVDYLDAVVPDPPLLPRDPADRAHVLALTLVIGCDIHPLNNLRVRRILTGVLGHDEEQSQDWQRFWIAEGFDALEALAAERAGRFLFGDAPSVADVFLIPQIYNARRLNKRLDDYPLLTRVEAEANALEAFAAAAPERVVPQGSSPRA